MKLPSLLKALQTNEHKEFERFLQSPFFKASEQYLAFFKHLCKHHPGFELGKVELETAYRTCFGKQALTESKLYNLMSGLAAQVELYLSVKLLAPDGKGGSRLQRELLVKSLEQRNMGAYFRTEAERLIEEMDKLPAKTLQDYHTLEQLHLQIYFNPDTPKYGAASRNLPSALQQLDMHYYIAKLRYAVEMKVRERLFQVTYDLPMLEPVLAMTAAPDILQEHPLAGVYNRLVRLYLQGFDEHGFKVLCELFIEKVPFLPRDDQQLILRHLINYGISLVAQGFDVQTEMLSLYKIAIETDMLLDDNRLTHSAYFNIASLAAKCGDFDWAWAFIRQFSNHLEETMRQAATGLAAASVFYAQGKLDEAQKSLTQESFMVAGFDIVARGLLLKIAFDRYTKLGKDYEFLLSHLHAFKRFVKTKEWAPHKKKAQLNCLKMARKMAVVKFESVTVSKEERQAMREQLAQLQPIVLKDWLLERIEQI